ncbi:hypothetical protein ACXWTF_03590 [Thiomicrolovo sp. ZZH C-3]
MKTKLLLLILPLIALAQEGVQPDMQWVDQEIAAIKPPRKGVHSSALYGLRDPFRAQLILNQPAKAKGTGTYVKRPARRYMTLESVINSRSALIDGKWYKQDDTIYGYVITKIERDSVMLQKKKKQVTLTLKKKNPKIQINAK